MVYLQSLIASRWSRSVFVNDASAASLEQPIRRIGRKSRRRNATLSDQVCHPKLMNCLRYTGCHEATRVPVPELSEGPGRRIFRTACAPLRADRLHGTKLEHRS